MTARVFLRCADGQTNAHSFLIPEDAHTVMSRWFQHMQETGDYGSQGIDLDRIWMASGDEPPTWYVLSSQVAAIVDEEDPT